MANYRTTRIIPVALVLIIVAVAIFGLIYFAQLLFFPGGNGSTDKSDTGQSALTDISANRSVIMTVRGKIVANENFRSYQIEITPNKRILTIYKGYLNQSIDNLTFDNNIPAYEQFVYALSRAKLMNSNELTGDSNDTRGICATGFLYEFQVLKSNKTVKKLWRTSCSNARGSLGINVKPVSDLFIVQIPGGQSKIGAIW